MAVSGKVRRSHMVESHVFDKICNIYIYIYIHTYIYIYTYIYVYTGLFISPSGISELDCATTRTDRQTDTAERSISIDRESLEVFFFVLEAVAYLQVSPLGGQS
jgi:hypothetical protein